MSMVPDPTQIRWPAMIDNQEESTVFLKPLVASPKIEVGEFTYYNDADDPTLFETRNVLYTGVHSRVGCDLPRSFMILGVQVFDRCLSLCRVGFRFSGVVWARPGGRACPGCPRWAGWGPSSRRAVTPGLGR